MEKLIDRIEEHFRQKSGIKKVWRDFVTENNVLVDLLVMNKGGPRRYELMAFKFFPSLFEKDSWLDEFAELKFDNRYAVTAKAPRLMSQTTLSKFYAAGVGLLVVVEGDPPLKGLLHARTEFRDRTFLPPRVMEQYDK